MSLLYVWYAVEDSKMHVSDTLGMVARAELAGALNAVLAIEDLIERTNEHDITKDFILQVLGWLQTNILMSIREIARETWPYRGVEDALSFMNKQIEEKAAYEKKEVKTAPTPVPMPG